MRPRRVIGLENVWVNNKGSRSKAVLVPKNKRKKVKVNMGKKKESISEKFAGIQLERSAAVRPVKKVTGTVRMSKCALRYALACSNPFEIAARGACVPNGSAPSMKTHATCRFDVTIGTTGFAVILLAPSLANDLNSIFYTNSSYAGATFCPFAASATYGAAGVGSAYNTGWALATHNGPFTASQLAGNEVATVGNASSVYGKVVSCGVRVQYTGTTLNESGLMYCYHDPAHGSLSGVSTLNLGNFGDVNIEGVTRKPCMLTAHSVSPSEQCYSNEGNSSASSTAGLASLLYPYSAGDYSWDSLYGGTTSFNAGASSGSTGSYVFPIGVPVGAIIVTGVAGQTFHLEAIFHMEFSGTGAASMLTPTTPDPVGSEMVRTAALALPQMKLANPRADVWNLMYESLVGVAKAAIPYAVPLAKAGIAALLG